MSQAPIRFDDGAVYERAMGIWSQLAGQVFLDWLTPSLGRRWIDVGCGNGAFTELLVGRCAPSEIQGIDQVSDRFQSLDSHSGWQRSALLPEPASNVEHLFFGSEAELTNEIFGRLTATNMVLIYRSKIINTYGIDRLTK